VSRSFAYYRLAVFEALTGLEFEQALDVVTRVQRLLQECVKVRRGGDPEAEQQQRGDDASAVAQSAARSMIEERPARRRGGDRHAAQRRELHDGNAGLAAIDSSAPPAEPRGRAVVSDDGREIRLTVYTEAADGMAVVLTTAGAVHLAGQLLQAASPKLPGPQ
jgi:hypothetical protein